MPLSHVKGGGKRTYRWLFSQVLAASAQNFTLLDLGMAISFSTILIPALLGAEGPLSFTKEQASWFGSINFILQPIGSILSGPICETLGRKKSLLVANFPHVAAWLMIYFGQDVATLFGASAILGLGTGFMEAPIITYVGEISHPSVRGAMTAYCETFGSMGIFMAYLFGSLMPWRLAAIICLIFPLATIVTLFLIPESPVWLLTKNRKDEALKALCWIRGWCDPSEVKQEFEDLVQYQIASSQCARCLKTSTKPTLSAFVTCPHKDAGIFKRIKYGTQDLTRKELMRPLYLSFLMFFIQQTNGLNGIRPNMINVYNSFGMGVDGHLATVVTGLIGIIGTIAMMVLVRSLGKRFLNLLSLVACTVCTFILGVYAYVVLPHDISSYAPEKIAPTSSSWLPMLLFVVFNLLASAGISIMPWAMLSEIFPLRGRGTACGVAAAFCYLMNSIVSKLYFDIETFMGLYGVMWLFSGFSLFGLISMYFLMPETEGKPFEEIEKDFSGKRVSIFASDCVSRRIFKDRIRSTKIQKKSMDISTVGKEVAMYRNKADECSKL